MKYRKQIYVIPFPFNYKMKEIVILFFTFLGICKAFAQNPSGDTVPGSFKNNPPVMQKPVADSLLGAVKATAKLYPNPAHNKAELEVKGFEPGHVQLQIIDLNGTKLRDDKRLLLSGNENITVMFALSPGIYFVILRQVKKLVKIKMVVQ
jgi:Secretion system C-terminal sorting domain